MTRTKKRTNRSTKKLKREMDETPRQFLNYNGDVSDMIGQVVGPDRFGAYYKAVVVAHNPENNRSRVGFCAAYRPGLGGRVRVQH